MKYELLEFAGIIWCSGILYLFFALVSGILFGNIRLGDIFKLLFLIIVWPLLLFSPAGRKKIWLLINIL